MALARRERARDWRSPLLLCLSLVFFPRRIRPCQCSSSGDLPTSPGHLPIPHRQAQRRARPPPESEKREARVDTDKASAGRVQKVESKAFLHLFLPHLCLSPLLALFFCLVVVFFFKIVFFYLFFFSFLSSSAQPAGTRERWRPIERERERERRSGAGGGGGGGDEGRKAAAAFHLSPLSLDLSHLLLLSNTPKTPKLNDSTRSTPALARGRTTGPSASSLTPWRKPGAGTPGSSPTEGQHAPSSANPAPAPPAPPARSRTECSSAGCTRRGTARSCVLMGSGALAECASSRTPRAR